MSEIFKMVVRPSLGYIGIRETDNALFGGEHLYDSEQLRVKALQLWSVCLRGPWISGKDETGCGFSLYSTPSETSVTASAVWIPPSSAWCRSVTDGCYTSSFHLGVEEVNRTAKSISAYPPLADGGFICHGECPEHSAQPEGAGRCVSQDYSYQHVPYIAAPTRHVDVDATSAALPAVRILLWFTCEMRQPRAARASRLPVACAVI
ncbi:hypothetical protein KCP75_23665 [Salmonella enterica subsp. enterica]|nr:hypothetical protein KCP75_23665 [Salmonella enterica subsp. enterica]